MPVYTRSEALPRRGYPRLYGKLEGDLISSHGAPAQRRC